MRCGVLLAVCLLANLSLLVPPGAGHYPPEHGEVEWRARDGVVNGVGLHYRQARGCGFSPLTVGFRLTATLVDAASARVRLDFGDGSEALEATLDAAKPSVSWDQEHGYPLAQPGVKKIFNPKVSLDGKVVWEAMDASTDEGPWQVWAVGRKAAWLYLGHDQVVGPDFTRADKKVVTDNGIALLMPSTLTAAANGRVTANHGRSAVGAKVFGQEIGAPADVKLEAEVGLTQVHVDQGCALKGQREVKVVMAHTFDASVGLNPGGGAASGSFRATLNDGTGSTQVAGSSFSAAVLYVGERWTGSASPSRTTTYHAETNYDVFMKYELAASCSSVAGIVNVSMGEGMPEYSTIAGTFAAGPKLGVQRLTSITFDWTEDLHNWQG